MLQEATSTRYFPLVTSSPLGLVQTGVSKVSPLFSQKLIKLI